MQSKVSSRFLLRQSSCHILRQKNLSQYITSTLVLFSQSIYHLFYCYFNLKFRESALSGKSVSSFFFILQVINVYSGKTRKCEKFKERKALLCHYTKNIAGDIIYIYTQTETCKNSAHTIYMVLKTIFLPKYRHFSIDKYILTL